MIKDIYAWEKFLVISIVFISGCAQILGFDEKKDPLPYLGKDGEDVTSDEFEDRKDGEDIASDEFEDRKDGEDIASDEFEDRKDGEDIASDDFNDFDFEAEIPKSCGDGNVDDGEECDDGRNGNPDDGCKDDCTYSCHNDSECDNGHDCTLNLCITSTHTCDFQLSPSGTICRASVGECDIAEYCDGVNPDCPADSFQLNTYVCRASAGECDVEEKCTGISPDCPSDGFASSGTPCNDGNSCTSSDQCDGNGNCLGENIFKEISAGYYHTCALMNTGGVKCWGDNGFGELGDGTYTSRMTPVDVSGLTSGVSGISGGEVYTCALMSIGGVKCWGYNEYGQLGDGTTTQRTTPVDVSGLTSGVSAISADYVHTCALMNTGGVKCWGDNEFGQLGDGTTTGSSTPVDVSGLTSGVSAISVGGRHTCALMSTGGVKCWGWNGYGQLGDGTTTQRTTPVNVLGLSSGVSAIFAGFGHTCALMSTGGVKCWGLNNHGQLGDGTTTQRTIPIDVSGLSSGVSAISADYEYTCALMRTGGVKCWGLNDHGQLGDGTTTQRTTPVDVSGLSSGVSAISVGRGHTCALMSTGGVKCWGYNEYGQLGDGTETDRTTPVDVVCP